MTLSEAIEEVKDNDGLEYEEGEYFHVGITVAIATILNAVVKGELK